MSQDLLNNFFLEAKINALCVKTEHAKHFSFYFIKIKNGSKISKIKSFLEEISIILNSVSLPLITLLPNDGLIRLDVMNKIPESVSLNSIWAKDNSVMPFTLGESYFGNTFTVDFSKNPHLLIAGSTGSGKSILLHNLIFNSVKNDCDIYLIDTKQVEFSAYKKISKIALSYDSAVLMIKSLIEIMDQRYYSLSKFPFLSFKKIVLIIDEMSDLILNDEKKILQNLLIKLSSKCRAASIYCIAATQRPSTDVITGALKAQFPARLALKTASKFDSQVIFDECGAEKLIGNGDALFKNPSCQTTRLKVAFCNPEMVHAINL